MEPQDRREHRASKALRVMRVLMVPQDLMDHGARKVMRVQRDLRDQKEFKVMMAYQVMTYYKFQYWLDFDFDRDIQLVWLCLENKNDSENKR